MAVASLIFGLLSVLLAMSFFTVIGPVIGIIFGGIGILLSVLARRQGQNPFATAGFITSIIGAIMSLIFYLACMACISGARFVGDRFYRDMEKSGFDINKAQETFRKQFDDQYRKQFDDAFKKAQEESGKKVMKDSGGQKDKNADW